MGVSLPTRKPFATERLLLFFILPLVVFIVLCRFLLWFQSFPQGWAAFQTVCGSLFVSAILTFGLFERPPPIGIRAIVLRVESYLWSRRQVTFHSMFAGLAFTLLLEAIPRIQQPMLDLSLNMADYFGLVLSAVAFGGLLSWFVLGRLPLSNTYGRRKA